MRTALVLVVTRAEMAAMITDEHYDGVVLQIFLSQRLQDRPHGFVDTLHVTVIARKLRLPVAREEAQILRNKRVLKPFGVAFGRNKGIGIVLEVRLKLRNHQEKRPGVPLLQEIYGQTGEVI